MATNIQIKCIDQTLTITSKPIIASGGVGEDTISVSFCQKWDEYGKVAVFWRTENAAFTVALDAYGTATIPHEVLATEGTLYIGIYGTNGDNVRTSEVLRYKICKGSLTEGTTPEEPSTELWQQVLAIMGETQQIATDVETAQATFEIENTVSIDPTTKHWLIGGVDTGIMAEGHAAGFGTPVATATGLAAGASPTVSVQASGADTALVMTFAFGIPKGDKGDRGESIEVDDSMSDSSENAVQNKIIKAYVDAIDYEDVGASPTVHANQHSTAGADPISPVDIGAATTATHTATLLASGWSATAPYTQTVSVAGILTTDNPIVDVVLSDTTATAENQIKAWAYVSRITTATGQIVATCNAKLPTVDLPIQLKAVR